MFEFKQLYIRKGNIPELKDILIIGDEAGLGSRDNAYKISKGLDSTSFKFIYRKDPYTKSENLFYVHASPNVILDTEDYPRDHQVHEFVKKYCKDLVVWDGEADQGRVRSREAFIVKNPNLIDRVIEELYARIEDEIHGKRKTITEYKIKKATGKVVKETLLLAPRIVGSVLTLPLKNKTRKKLLKKIWK